MVQGREEGVRNERLHTMRSMKAKGFETSLIAEILGLPEEEVRQLLHVDH